MATRRKFIRQAVAAAGTLPVLQSFPNNASPIAALKPACQAYTWFTYFARENKDWNKDLDTSFDHFAASRFDGFEASFEQVQQVHDLEPHLRNHNIWMKSMYMNVWLHEEDKVDQNIATAMAVSKASKGLFGIEIVVVNPTPIRWHGPENKTDGQLTIQGKALNRLGGELRKLGLKLAYHNHDAEMRLGAREFHHMLAGTDPENVRLCLDPHWIFRGAGDSEVAVFDAIKLYGDRIEELHLRQSVDGIWSECFGPGDIDYRRLAEEVYSYNKHPHIVLEQACETGTPQTMDAVEANKRSLAYIMEIFA